jgi:hypothetical protein
VSPAARLKTKNHIFFSCLESFDKAVDCAAANNRLKRRRDDRTGRIRACAGIGSHYQNPDHFLDAKPTTIRVRKMLCHRAGIRARALAKPGTGANDARTGQELGKQ